MNDLCFNLGNQSNQLNQGFRHLNQVYQSNQINLGSDKKTVKNELFSRLNRVSFSRNKLNLNNNIRCKMFRNSFLGVLFVLSAVSLFSQEQVSLDLTIYSNNFGVIRDVRSFNLNKGISDLKFSGIPATINPQSIFLKFDGQILEQSFRNDIENRLLKKPIMK